MFLGIYGHTRRNLLMQTGFIINSPKQNRKKKLACMRALSWIRSKTKWKETIQTKNALNGENEQKGINVLITELQGGAAQRVQNVA